MIEKLKSRKLILAIVSALIVIANDGLGLGLEGETIKDFVKLVMTYIGSQGAVDLAAAIKKTA